MDSGKTAAGYQVPIKVKDTGEIYMTPDVLQAATPLQDGAEANGNGTAFDVTGMATAVLTIGGITTATINFEGTEDGETWSALLALKIGSSAIATTAAADGVYIVRTSGLVAIRARVSGYSAGTIDISAHAVPVVYAPWSTTLYEKIAGENIAADKMTVEHNYAYTNIASATTTVVKSGAGLLHTLTVNTTAAGAITIYDNTSATGTKIATLKASVGEQTFIFDVAFTTGLTIVTAAASDITVSSR